MKFRIRHIVQSIAIAIIGYNWFVGLLPALAFAFAVNFLTRFSWERFHSRLLTLSVLLSTFGLSLVATGVLNQRVEQWRTIAIPADILVVTLLAGAAMLLTGLDGITIWTFRPKTSLWIAFGATAAGVGITALSAATPEYAEITSAAGPPLAYYGALLLVFTPVRFAYLWLRRRNEGRNQTQERNMNILGNMGLLGWSLVLLASGILLTAAFAYHREVPNFVGTVGGLLVTISILGIIVGGLRKISGRGRKPAAEPPSAPGRDLSPDERILASAKFKMAALGQRADQASLAYAAQLGHAIDTADYIGMSVTLSNEHTAEIESALGGFKPYWPSGGRPEVIELSTYLERQAQAAETEERRSIYEAGIAGETLLVQKLESMLDESWSIICGYQNTRGETDVIVVGPHGVCAMEIKNYRGIINIQGQNWMRSRYDRFGNPPDPRRDAHPDSGRRGTLPLRPGQPDFRRPGDRARGAL